MWKSMFLSLFLQIQTLGALMLLLLLQTLWKYSTRNTSHSSPPNETVDYSIKLFLMKLFNKTLHYPMTQVITSWNFWLFENKFIYRFNWHGGSLLLCLWDTSQQHIYQLYITKFFLPIGNRIWLLDMKAYCSFAFGALIVTYLPTTY